MLRLIMRVTGNVLKIAALCGLASVVHAQADAPDPSTTATAVASAPPPNERSWRIGAAFGYGERTNPLIQSDDIPVLVTSTSRGSASDGSSTTATWATRCSIGPVPPPAWWRASTMTASSSARPIRAT
jgi:hypothetical protein